ncbi:hypothetical protein TNIN_311851 [Trichonephila inaurata madagascariensis]|uniref:LRRCT domain-containing protein n=1 Tax=Trichonephila inaurata madagascariensis TaxID=2747483 RepID=A0A8X6YMM7_9ARAC|nr:hypothetical protein TNIN_311851 [Trichonephila inaurata madagascariensis]
MPDLKELQMVGNQLGELTKDSFASIVPKLTTFKMHDNPIKCGCSIHWITSIDRSKWRGPWFSGECTAPKELEGKSLKELNNSHFQHCRE